jgi:hypothetical protein
MASSSAIEMRKRFQMVCGRNLHGALDHWSSYCGMALLK